LRPPAGAASGPSSTELLTLYWRLGDAVLQRHRGTVYNVVTQALPARQAHSADQMRHLELARLEAAHAALWPRAMQGHVPSVAALLRILDLEMPVAKPLRAGCQGREGPHGPLGPLRGTPYRRDQQERLQAPWLPHPWQLCGADDRRNVAVGPSTIE